MFVLTEAERIAILAGCVGLLCIVVLLTVCFVCPYCWFYQLITRRKSKEDAEMNLFRMHFPGVFLDHDPPPPYEPSNKNSFFDLQSPLNFGRRLTPMNSVSTISSETDSVTGIPLPLMSDTELPANEMKETSAYARGNVSITLQFKRITGEEKKIFTQLRVDMKEAADLPPRPYGGSCDPYFIIAIYDKSIYKKKKKKPSPPPIHQFYSTIAKKNQQPVYNESFFFPIDPKELKKTVLKIEAWDQDKWANDTLLGEVFFNMKDVSSMLLKEPSKELDLNLKIEDSKQINGQLLLGLCYLPTSERMTVAVLKATNLKLNEKPPHLEFYVQAMAIYGGKVFERRKTSSRPSSSFPVFNEMLMFDIPFAKLDQIVLLLTIRYDTNSKGKDEKTDRQNLPKTKDTCIGKVIIGSFGRKSCINHWHAMRSSPRRQVVQWHELR